MLQAVLDSPMALLSRSFGFAEIVPKCVAVTWLTSGWRVAGEDGWLTANVWQWI
ncbi:MAG TPA: hypothetical protein VGK21_15675 [Candidatus Angelobacter sp.]